MKVLNIGFSLFLTMSAGFSVQAVAQDGIKHNGIETVRKTCECVRRHPSGFPYIETRITNCKVTKNGQGDVEAMDCVNCYTVCSDKPTS